jgi:hypothetical protein
VTEEINAKLGKVVVSEDTEEMLEQEVKVENPVYVENKDNW